MRDLPIYFYSVVLSYSNNYYSEFIVCYKSVVAISKFFPMIDLKKNSVTDEYIILITSVNYLYMIYLFQILVEVR